MEQRQIRHGQSRNWVSKNIASKADQEAAVMDTDGGNIVSTLPSISRYLDGGVGLLGQPATYISLVQL